MSSYVAHGMRCITFLADTKSNKSTQTSVLQNLCFVPSKLKISTLRFCSLIHVGMVWYEMKEQCHLALKVLNIVA